MFMRDVSHFPFHAFLHFMGDEKVSNAGDWRENSSADLMNQQRVTGPFTSGLLERIRHSTGGRHPVLPSSLPAFLHLPKPDNPCASPSRFMLSMRPKPQAFTFALGGVLYTLWLQHLLLKSKLPVSTTDAQRTP